MDHKVGTVSKAPTQKASGWNPHFRWGIIKKNRAKENLVMKRISQMLVYVWIFQVSYKYCFQGSLPAEFNLNPWKLPRNLNMTISLTGISFVPC